MNRINHCILHCGSLSAAISPIGGELRSLQYRGKELLWQGDPTYWEGSAPFLFPFCGRVKDGVYSWQGKDYPMPIHGFLPEAALTVTAAEADSLTLTLTDTPETRAVYPFSFHLSLCYTLHRDGLIVTATVTAGDTGLPFSFGAHPGFHLPVSQNGFRNADLRFDKDLPLSRIEITKAGLLGDGRDEFPLSQGRLPLSPDPAGGCGIFFEIPEAQRALTLSAPALPCDLRMEFADFPVLGLWHAEGAPYLCIEPWQGLPAPDGIPTVLDRKPVTLYLAPGQQKRFTLRIICQRKDPAMYTDHLEQFTLTLADILKSIKKLKDQRMSAYGLRSTHVIVLYVLGRKPEGLTPAELSEASDVDKALISRVVAELTEKGFVTAIAQSGRRYKARLCLTEEGKEISYYIANAAKTIQEKVSGNIPKEDLEVFYRTLFVLQENFQKLAEESES